MVQGPSIDAIEALRSLSASVDEQITILRQLKNDIVGHLQRKELVVRQGAVEPLVHIIRSQHGDAVSPNPDNGSNGSWSKEDEACYQATLVLGSLAKGGTHFLQPLDAAGVPDCLLNIPLRKPKMAKATLQALRSLMEWPGPADASQRARIDGTRSLRMFSEVLEGTAMLRQPYSPQGELIRLTLEIMTAAASNESCRAAMLSEHVLGRLIHAFVDNAFSIDTRSNGYGFSEPRPSRSLGQIMSAIAAIIQGSLYRTEWFIQHTALRQLLATNTAWPTFAALPDIHVPPPGKTSSFHSGTAAFPALTSMQSNGTPYGSGATFGVSSRPGKLYYHEHLVCLLLLSIARSTTGLTQIAALRLLAPVNEVVQRHDTAVMSFHEAAQKAAARERYMALCAVPLAVRMIQQACEKTPDSMTATEKAEHRELKPQACEVLALLIPKSPDLQIAAVEANAIKRISPVLKKSFDIITSTKPMWSPHPISAHADQMSASCTLGPKSMSDELKYAMRCREAALLAITALTMSEDVHRQAIVQAGLVTCIIDSLKPFSAEALDEIRQGSNKVNAKDGNTTEVIIAGCRAGRAMSRSVCALRTSLIDAGIAKPTFDLLKHSDPEVRLAATELVCNLVLEFSPMREELVAAGAVKTLVQQAKESEPDLRLISLWALKHLVLSASKDIKMQTYNELGKEWLIAAIQGAQDHGDPQDIGGVAVSISSSGALSAPNAAGERVSLLNPSSMDVDYPPIGQDDDEDGEMLWDESAATSYRPSGLRSTLAREDNDSTEKYLEGIRDIEQNEALKAKRDDIATQEQALDFLRNMLTGDDLASILEYLLKDIGNPQLYNLVTEKLVPVATAPSTRNGNSSRPIYGPTELILNAINVINHLANSTARHKELLLAQNSLLQAWLPHFEHPVARIRLLSVWAVCSIVWVTDEGDRANAAQRVRKLAMLGFGSALARLRADVDADVRERVKVAWREFENAGVL